MVAFQVDRDVLQPFSGTTSECEGIQAKGETLSSHISCIA
jgi:hypothetical protein